MNLWDFEAIDWDPDDDEDGNLAHCLRHGVDERIVSEVLSEQPVEVKTKMATVEIAILGPDFGGKVWLLFFDWSFKRGDWLRPVTGRKAEKEEIDEWKRVTGHNE